jgi:hypothetical protein
MEFGPLLPELLSFLIKHVFQLALSDVWVNWVSVEFNQCIRRLYLTVSFRKRAVGYAELNIDEEVFPLDI